MTSQVVLLNGFGVAIASDSAMTLGESRTYDTAEKVFPIGGVHRIAALHSGSVFLHEYPFQVLVSEWSQTLPNDPLPTVEAYLQSFLFWLTRLAPSVSQKNQTDQYGVHFEAALGIAYRETKKICDAGTANAFAIAKETIKTKTQDMLTWKKIQNSDADFIRGLMSKHEEWNKGRVEYWFDDWPADTELNQLAMEYAFQYLQFGYWSGRATLAFCGFGKDQILPAYSRVDIYGIIGNRCLWREIENSSYNPQVEDRLFSIYPLGQTDAIFEFLKGVDSQVVDLAIEVAFEASDIGEELLKNEIIKRIDTHPNKQEFSQLIESSLEDEGRINEVASRVEKLTNERFEQHMEDTRLERLRKVVRGIPPATLASVAQSLISIVPLRQALSGELGTVGGPIDVATITRADGFKWVQHKSIGL
jgi:hypothetical protein